MAEGVQTGAELRAHRKRAGLSQVSLARLAGVGRHAVQYWEARPALPSRGWATSRLLRALGLPDYHTPNARARAWGLSRVPDWRAKLDAEVEAKLAAQREREAARAARRRIVCGARTRKGLPCRLLSEPGRKRCKFHGGKSTGPRTAEGRARIAEAQRRRWALIRTRGPINGWNGRPTQSVTDPTYLHGTFKASRLYLAPRTSQASPSSAHREVQQAGRPELRRRTCHGRS